MRAKSSKQRCPALCLIGKKGLKHLSKREITIFGSFKINVDHLV